MKRICLLAISVILISSCGNLSLDTDSVIVDSIDPGQVLTIGDVFDISLTKSSDSVIVDLTSAIVKITPLDHNNMNNEFRETLEYDIDLEEYPNPKFEVTTDFQDGLYNIQITVYDNDSIASEYEAEFIVYSGFLSGSVFGLHPSLYLYTNSKVLLESEVTYSEYIDPYLVWSFEDEVFFEGYLSDGTNSAVWDTLDRVGFIDIKLELYPYKLESYVESNIYVNFSFVINPIMVELSLSQNYENEFKVLYFNGNYIDEVNKELEIYSYGETNPMLVQDFYGMEINSDQGFLSDDSLFPFDPIDNGIDPIDNSIKDFSILLDFIPLNSNDGSIIYNEHGNYTFSLFSQDGFLKNSITSSDINSEVVDIVKLIEGQSINLIINFSLIETGFSIDYYIDSILVNSSELIIDNNLLVDEPFSRSIIVGGYSDTIGFNAVLDTLQVSNYLLIDLNDSNITDLPILESIIEEL
ncbi:MAG: hypothetical protein OCD02_05945 [Spirochaetaceae bacterium]